MWHQEAPTFLANAQWVLVLILLRLVILVTPVILAIPVTLGSLQCQHTVGTGKK